MYLETDVKKYSERYDAFYNPQTDEWLDTKCDDATCEYCSDRPEFPSQVTSHEFK